MEAGSMAAYSFQKFERAHDIRANERGRVVERVIVVGFGGEIDDDVGVLHQRIYRVTVRNITFDERHAV